MAANARWASLLLLTALALAPVACAVPVRVSAYAERGADLSRYRTYDFATSDPAPTGDPRLDSNPFFNQHVQEAVDRELAARGYARATSGAPDFLVHFHASVVQDIDVVEQDTQLGYCGENNCRPFVYDAGTLLMDFVDTGTKALVWRGWAESAFDGIVDNQTWLEERIDTSVARIMAKVPRTAASPSGR